MPAQQSLLELLAGNEGLVSRADVLVSAHGFVAKDFGAFGKISGHEVDDPVGWVAASIVDVAQALEPVHCLACRAQVEQLAHGRQQQLVKQAPDGGARLVDGAHDGHAATSQCAHGLHHGQGTEGIQATGGLVEEENAGVGHQRTGNRQTSLLASRQTYLG